MALSESFPPLDEHDLAATPEEQFGAWFDEARAEGIPLTEAMTLATASTDGSPSARIVLLKGVDEGGGFLFFTNYASRKGRELDANPRAALVFHWQPLGRQVRVEGTVGRIPEAESEAYFRTRPRPSRLSAWASHQSEPISGRDVLERRVEELEREHPGDDVPLPPIWGGYRLEPDSVEFWQHRENRLHDRLRYRRDGTGWLVERLAP